MFIKLLLNVVSKLKNPITLFKNIFKYIKNPNSFKLMFNLLLIQEEMKTNKTICRSRPNIIHLLCQGQCNLNCEFCGFDYRTNAVKEQLTFENFKKIIKNLHPEILTELIFSGQGEPLLCKDLEKMVHYIKKKYKYIKNTINTNGIALNNKNFGLINDYFDHIIVSLHSVIPETYKLITNVNACDRVINNLYNFRKQNETKTITLYFTYSKRNINEIKLHLDLVKELGNITFLGSYCKFYSYKPQFSDRYNNNLVKYFDRNLSLFHDQKMSDDIIQDAQNYAKSLGINAFFPPLFNKPFQERKTCCFPYDQLEVHYDGTIFPCGGADIWMFEKIMNNELNFGNILKQDIDEFWNNQDYQNLRQSAAGTAKNRKNPRCENCSTMGFLVDSGNILESHFIER